MIYPIGASFPVVVQYIKTADGTGATGLTPTVTVKRFETDGSVTSLVGPVATVEIGDGWYGYWIDGATYNTALGAVTATFKTADTTVTQKHVGAGYPIAAANAFLDGSVLSRAPATTALSTAIWTNALATSLTTAAATVAAYLNASVSSIITAVASSFSRITGINRASVLSLVQADTWAETLTVNAFVWAAGGELRLTVKDKFTYKHSVTDADSILQWLLTFGGSASDGLTYIKQTAAGANQTKGSLAVTDDDNGQVVMNLDEVISALIQGEYIWDIKHYSAAVDPVVTTLGGGTLVIEPTVTYSIT